MLKQKISRRRCTECRRWYLPSAQTAHNQKTCGREQCRKRRHARLVRRQRALSLQDSRVSERERQRECRRRQRQKRVSPPRNGPPDVTLPLSVGGAVETMSLTGLELEAAEILSIIQKNWDTMALDLDPVSLSGFKLQLLEILRKSGRSLGQMGQENTHVTGRQDFVTSWKHEERDLVFGTKCHWPAVTDVAKFET